MSEYVISNLQGEESYQGSLSSQGYKASTKFNYDKPSKNIKKNLTLTEHEFVRVYKITKAKGSMNSSNFLNVQSHQVH